MHQRQAFLSQPLAAHTPQPAARSLACPHASCCRQCQASQRSQNSRRGPLKKQLQEQLDRQTCRKCSQIHASRNQLFQHIYSNSCGDSRPQCRLCRTRFPSRNQLFHHLRSCDGTPPPLPPPPSIPTPLPAIQATKPQPACQPASTAPPPKTIPSMPTQQIQQTQPAPRIYLPPPHPPPLLEKTLDELIEALMTRIRDTSRQPVQPVQPVVAEPRAQIVEPWKIYDIGLFWPDAEESRYGKQVVFSDGKATCYRDVELFIESARRQAHGDALKAVAINQQWPKLLRGSALLWWNQTLTDLERSTYTRGANESWTQALSNRFRAR